jgi:dual specificity MAP kinase phosphatase
LCASRADHPHEDILCVLYDVFDVIEAAVAHGGHVLVHCSQGVSRSASLAIGYLMWKTGCYSYPEICKVVKGQRGITNPNVGFMCQLIEWGVSTLMRAEFL